MLLTTLCVACHSASVLLVIGVQAVPAALRHLLPASPPPTHRHAQSTGCVSVLLPSIVMLARLLRACNFTPIACYGCRMSRRRVLCSVAASISSRLCPQLYSEYKVGSSTRFGCLLTLL